MHTSSLSNNTFQRALKGRHIQLIALGGIIGSGYFLGTGEVVKMVGPAVFLAYLLGGLIIYLTMLCMGELAVAIPISGSFITYTAEFISPAIACGVGWSYWLNWIAYIPAECIAGGIIMQHFTGINSYIWALSIGCLITYVNLVKVGTFGEIEFWLAIIKVAALAGFVILSMLIFFGIIDSPHTHGLIGEKFIFNTGGFFPKGVMPLLTAMVLLLVNYQGSEIIGLAAGESMNPAKMIPQAIKTVTFRILFIYIVPIFCLVLIFPWNKANLHNSVFADALSYHGLKWAGIATSFVALSATLSCSNSGVYGVIRSLHALAENGMAPRAFAVLNQHAVPQNAGLATLIGIWVVLGLSYFFGQTQLYIALLLVSGFTGALAWISLCWAQINFRKSLLKRGYKKESLRYQTPYSPYTGLLAIVLMVICLLFLCFNQRMSYQLAFYMGLGSFVIPTLCYKLFGYAKKHKSHSIFEKLYPPVTP